ncbi:hypothetical protein [Enterococcus casseliflavus]|uniref:hypothetical protein n=1 Tax=Enterococcus casseliflavus TaxID=37734 RepID=UPI0039A59B1E
MLISLNCLKTSISCIENYVLLMNKLFSIGQKRFILIEDKETDFFIMNNWNKIMELVSFSREDISLLFIGDLEKSKEYEIENKIKFDECYENTIVDKSIYDLIQMQNLKHADKDFIFSQEFNCLIEIINKVMIKTDIKTSIDNDPLTEARLTLLSETFDMKHLIEEDKFVVKIDSIELLEFLLSCKNSLKLDAYALIEEIFKNFLFCESNSKEIGIKNE